LKKILKPVVLLAVAQITLFSAEHIFPPEWDNVVQAMQSSRPVLISNFSTLSTQTRTLGGKSGLRYRCSNPIPKISCRGGTADISTSISDVSLKEPNRNELVNIFASDSFVEDLGTSWKVCGAAIGGMTWDTSTLVKGGGVAGAPITLTYTYTPNSQHEIYYFFTSDPLRGRNTSYMTIETKQLCR